MGAEVSADKLKLMLSGRLISETTKLTSPQDQNNGVTHFNIDKQVNHGTIRSKFNEGGKKYGDRSKVRVWKKQR
jgi:hypothetical protein